MTADTLSGAPDGFLADSPAGMSTMTLTDYLVAEADSLDAAMAGDLAGDVMAGAADDEVFGAEDEWPYEPPADAPGVMSSIDLLGLEGGPPDGEMFGGNDGFEAEPPADVHAALAAILARIEALNGRITALESRANYSADRLNAIEARLLTGTLIAIQPAAEHTGPGGGR